MTDVEGGVMDDALKRMLLRCHDGWCGRMPRGTLALLLTLRLHRLGVYLALALSLIMITTVDA